MVVTPLIVLLVSVLGYANLNSTELGKLKLNRLVPSRLAITLFISGTVILFGAVFATFLLLLLWGLITLVVSGSLSSAWVAMQTLTGSPGGVEPDKSSVLLLFTIGLVISFLSVTKFQSKADANWKQNNSKFLIHKLVDDELELFLLRALEMDDFIPHNGDESPDKRMLVRVVLSNRKVYIGNLIRCDITRGVCSNIVLVPMHSGYQDESTLELQLTEHYEKHYSAELSSDATELQIKDFLNQYSLTIPVHHLVTASLFDLTAYQKFLTEKLNSM
ncbi:hypothetical protein [Idiomarina loihiensis]|uniref:Uncharacterized conserved membrane protein n=1 Tax=Idiomarina loihiensis (strain ATCC BAA-735 / DSM 15497 / L2-TR) TaxID=283942 RepID=Q5R088_IDILO|nr:hypothetical protein [Idiomarina loihiensis]AAV81372.1 Uncharacterized conserved membrane protein [Idiomarina loihiensis L2TR]AGM35399.1 hypothetical protein K734_02660 [Idiomarina loihiensis GSL 199]